MGEKSEPHYWRNTSSEQRSHLVQVLHWFHFRPAQLKRSWSKEEVLTWELIRALQILPQREFARPLVEYMATLSPEAKRAIAPLLAAERMRVTAYPSLGLDGAKRNSRSDIGFGTDQGPAVWVEAKTAPFNIDVLRKQLDQQQHALAVSGIDQPTIVATLLPDGTEVPGVPNISWGQVRRVFTAGIGSLRSRIKDHDLRAGYEDLAIEFIGRISSHPNEIAFADAI